jgi:hypothetical protein
MGHDSPAGAVRNLNRFGHLFLAQFLYVEVAEHIFYPAGSHQLDPVGAVLYVSAHRHAYFVNIVGQIRAARQGLTRGHLEEMTCASLS